LFVVAGELVQMSTKIAAGGKASDEIGILLAALDRDS
jgi:hypothetical protein